MMGKNKKNTGIAYEVLVQAIFQTLNDQEQVPNVVVERNKTLHGRATAHQIDVYWKFEKAGIPANFPHVRSIHTKIRGVTKENPDGANRQQIIKQWCRSGDALFLVREPNNPVDSNAIQVRRIVYGDTQDKYLLGEQIGYVSHELCRGSRSEDGLKGICFAGVDHECYRRG
jgi:HIRAN domain